MRRDLRKLLELVKSMHSRKSDDKASSIAIQGPPGSGKSYACAAAATWAVLEGERYGIYLSIVCESGKLLTRLGCDHRTQQYLHYDAGEVQWRKDLKAWPADLFGSSSRDLLTQGISLWPLCLGPSAARIILIVDDYDIIRERLSIDDFEALSLLRAQGTMIILSSRKLFVQFKTKQGEDIFLKDLVIRELGLPDYDDSIEIAKECWQTSEQEGFAEAKATGQVMEKLPSLSPEATEKVVAITGRYPGIISCLVRLTTQQRLKFRHETKNSTSQIMHWLEAAQQELAFNDYLQDLWKTLRTLDSTVLSLVAIANESGYQIDDLISRWPAASKLRATTVARSLTALQNYRLLVEREGKNYRIASSALQRYTIDAGSTQALAADLGIQLKSTKASLLGSTRLSVFLWLLGLAIFLIGTIFQGRDTSGLWKNIRYFAWSPWLFYLFVSGIQKLRERV